MTAVFVCGMAPRMIELTREMIGYGIIAIVVIVVVPVAIKFRIRRHRERLRRRGIKRYGH